jgi:flavorubredoxin
MVANGHGPLLRHNVKELIGRYRKVESGTAKAETSVVGILCLGLRI